MAVVENSKYREQHVEIGMKRTSIIENKHKKRLRVVGDGVRNCRKQDAG